MNEKTTAKALLLQNIPVPPTLPAKSSNDILCELFGAFNATPPPLDDLSLQESESVMSQKSIKKHKKHCKKKHKKLKKKKKKSSSSFSGSSHGSKKTKKGNEKKQKACLKLSTSDTESNCSKKKKRKLGKFSASDSDCEEEPRNKKKKSVDEKNHVDKVKIKLEEEEGKSLKVKDVNNCITEDILNGVVGTIVDNVIENTYLPSKLSKNTVLDSSHFIPKQIKEEPKNDSYPVTVSEGVFGCMEPPKNKTEVFASPLKALPVAKVFAEDLVECGIQKDVLNHKQDKPKVIGGKITIQNLKFSQVYEATVKQIEEEAKLKAEKYEEGELSESSDEPERSPTPSEHSSAGSIVSVEKVKESKHRHHRNHRKCPNRTRSSSNEKHRSHSHSKCSHSHKKCSHSRRHHCHRDKKKNKSKERERSRSRDRMRQRSSSRDGTRLRSTSRDRSRERNKERSRSIDGTRERNKARSRSRSHKKDRLRSKDRIRTKSKERSRSSDRKGSERSEKHRHGRSHSSNRDIRNSDEKIDKQKLLEIARKNALNMMKNPSGISEQTKVAITSGGKTVNELTDFCKLLSKKDADGHESISSNTCDSTDSESEKPFHHPFQIKDRPSNIVLNIRNSVALPVKSLQEKTAEQSRQLRLQFPVSSGQHHRRTESEWVPVSPKKPEVTTVPATQVAVIKPTSKPSKVFKNNPGLPNMDIGSIVSQRLMAMHKLQENPTDTEALTQMYAAQQNMQWWAESKQQPPGQFTGTTGVKVLSQAELAAGYQAWARRDQLQVAAPVTTGMGMALLQKMGWRPGEGLGKNKEGTLQPLLLEVKMDKKGLVAQEELPVRQPHQIIRGPPRNLEGKKNPVSLLNEYCSRHKLGPAYFELVDEAGPDHKKNFLFKVRVGGVEYKPAVGSPKKKLARAEAAEVCLKALGVLPNK